MAQVVIRAGGQGTPVEVGDAGSTVKNVSADAVTIYYRDEFPVGSGASQFDGQLASGQSVTLSGTQWFYVDRASGFSQGSLQISTQDTRPRYDTWPTDVGMLSWNFDPSNIAFSTTVTAGFVLASKVRVPTPMTVSRVGVLLRQAGTGATSLANCYTALYDKNGVRLGVSADQASDWAAALGSGYRAPVLTPDAPGSLTLPGGPSEYVYAARLIGTQSTTPSQQGSRGQAVGAVANVGLVDPANVAIYQTGVIPRAWSKGTSLSAMPATIDMTTVGPSSDFWVSIS